MRDPVDFSENGYDRMIEDLDCVTYISVVFKCFIELTVLRSK